MKLYLQQEMMVEHLLLQNAIEISGIDPETGEMLYSITDKLEQVNPKLYQGLKKDFEEHMFELIDQGPKIMTWRLRA
jgi:hypothetical protein